MRIKSKTDILSRLCEIGHDLSSSTDTDELLAKISASASEVCDSEAASIILLDEDRDDMYFKEAGGQMGEIIKRIRIPLTENSIAGWCIINREALIINDVSKDPRHYKKTDEATSFKTKSILAVPIVWADKVFGCIEAVNKNSGGEFTEKDCEYLRILAHSSAVALDNTFLMERLQNFFSYSMEVLITALETIEPLAKDHTVRVARLATTIARSMGLTGNELEQIWYAAYFHDVGKLARESIYISQIEMEKSHPATGAGLIENIKLLEGAAPFVRYHHEKWDGSGYPEGLSGPDIPLGAQIIGIAEDYDEKLIGSESVSDICEFNTSFIEYSGTKFNPEVHRHMSEILNTQITKNPCLKL